jgi:hypothetical protein
MDEKITDLSSQLTQRAESVRDELVNLEKQFALKKEEFLKIQGALEAVNYLNTQQESVEESAEEDTTEA